jgi:hypothetical protein
MNAAINSVTATSRPAIWRRSRAYKKKILQRILIGLPVVMIVGWEYRVWKRRLYYERNREHFPGSTNFYGKMWGYESDYMIEASLKDGDMVFWSTEPLANHINEAFLRFPYRRIKGDYDSWDFVGVVKKRSTDGRAVVVGSDGKCVLYSDLVADYRTSTLAVRSLIDTSSDGRSRMRISQDLENRSPVLDSLPQYLQLNPLTFAELSVKSLIKRFPRLESFGFGEIVREKSRRYPLDLIADDNNNDRIPQDRFIEISDVFMNPLIFDSAQISYSPPFFVRRLDNEYHNHNRTRNIVVDWEMLQQRDKKNRLVSK